MNSCQMVHITPKLVLNNELFVDIMAFKSRNSILLGGHLPIMSQVVSKLICSSVDNQLLLNRVDDEVCEVSPDLVVLLIDLVKL